MSILIKDMEKPKRCLVCPFMVSRDNDDCILQSDEANAKFNSWDDMKASCPLIEIPTPHGRLGDLDALQKQVENTIQDAHMSLLWKQGMMYAHGLVETSKTVIEAEGSE